MYSVHCTVAWGPRVPLESRFYRVRIFKMGKISFFVLVWAPGPGGYVCTSKVNQFLYVLSFHQNSDLFIYTHMAAIVFNCSSLIARRISALCLSMEMFKMLLKSFIIFRRSFVNSPWARKALTTEEYASNSEM